MTTDERIAGALAKVNPSLWKRMTKDEQDCVLAVLAAELSRLKVGKVMDATKETLECVPGMILLRSAFAEYEAALGEQKESKP